jgi:hypothetical protein
MAPKTEKNPRGGGRKPRKIPGKRLTVIIDTDLHGWLDLCMRRGRGKSDVVNIALRQLKNNLVP